MRKYIAVIATTFISFFFLLFSVQSTFALTSNYDPMVAELMVLGINDGENETISLNSASEESVILPDVTGKDLQRQLDRIYSPRRTLGYGSARDLLYAQIDNKDGFISGIYSGYRVPISPDSEKPREEATSHGIDAEHIWPQGKGARGSAKSDMHNLFPARKEVNNDRSNFPFAEIPDEQTVSWYFDDDEIFTKPDRDIDKYSEGQNGSFEPRESKKGDIARVMFYFRTMYPDQANTNFFNTQKDTLCKWNSGDPVDDDEVTRSHAIANTEQGNENPFVLDSSLVERAYCN